MPPGLAGDTLPGPPNPSDQHRFGTTSPTYSSPGSNASFSVSLRCKGGRRSENLGVRTRYEITFTFDVRPVMLVIWLGPCSPRRRWRPSLPRCYRIWTSGSGGGGWGAERGGPGTAGSRRGRG